MRQELLPYRFVIGQLLLDKVSQCRTVVNKLDKIENKYRIVPNELIAGDNDYITEISEHGCRYRLDLSKVFIGYLCLNRIIVFADILEYTTW